MSAVRAVPRSQAPLLAVEDLRVELPTGAWSELPSGRRSPHVRSSFAAVDGVSFAVARGESVALVGESGSGKTQLARAILGLSPAGARVSGRVSWEGREISSVTERERNQWRGGSVGLVLQEPASAFDPVRTIGSQIIEAVRLHRRSSASEARAAAIEALRDAAFPDPEAALGEYAHRLSGGLAQRAYLAMTLAAGPELLIADEPTAALDPTVAARVLERLDRLREERGLALLLVTHDLALVAPRSERMLVMYAGRVVESGPSEEVLRRPAHPYTRGLLLSAPRIEAEARPPGTRYETIPGAPPAPAERDASRCAFAPRCPERFARCDEAPPELYAAGASRARCFLHAAAK